MNISRHTGVLVVLALLVSGCASTDGSTWHDDWVTCALVSGVVGAGVGAAVDDDDAAVIGAVGGAAVGGMLCGTLNSDPWEPWRPPDSDMDGDGIVDTQDRCPNTPSATKVGADGCELDSDGDGIVDSLDNCANTPRGESVDSDGCELDKDGDGIVDNLDRCPNTPRGVRVGPRGCELDIDGDGVVDRMDKCPKTPTGMAVDNSGCELAEVVRLEGVRFLPDSDRLTDDSVATLNDAARILLRHPSLVVEIAGHTDSQGAAGYNLDLSTRRATAVLDFLVSKGANPDNLTARGYGESEPVADNGTAEGRALNRRVELRHD